MIAVVIQTLLSYTATEGERELVLLDRPDAPSRLLLLEVPRDRPPGDDVVVVDDELTTLAEARIVADGWAAEHAADSTVRRRTSLQRPAQSPGAERALARYRTPTGIRVLVGQRVAGTVCVTDRPAGGDGRVLLVQAGVATAAELDALVADYVAQSQARGEPARHTPAVLAQDLAGALIA